MRRKRDWNANEERTVRRDNGLKRTADIAHALGRSSRSVESKIARMKGRARIEYERNQLAEAEMYVVKHRISEQAA